MEILSQVIRGKNRYRCESHCFATLAFFACKKNSNDLDACVGELDVYNCG